MLGTLHKSYSQRISDKYCIMGHSSRNTWPLGEFMAECGPDLDQLMLEKVSDFLILHRIVEAVAHDISFLFWACWAFDWRFIRWMWKQSFMRLCPSFFSCKPFFCELVKHKAVWFRSTVKIKPVKPVEPVFHWNSLKVQSLFSSRLYADFGLAQIQWPVLCGSVLLLFTFTVITCC